MESATSRFSPAIHPVLQVVLFLCYDLGGAHADEGKGEGPCG